MCIYIYIHTYTRKRRAILKELCPFPPKTKIRKGKLNPKNMKKNEEQKSVKSKREKQR